MSRDMLRIVGCQMLVLLVVARRSLWVTRGHYLGKVLVLVNGFWKIRVLGTPSWFVHGGRQFTRRRPPQRAGELFSYGFMLRVSNAHCRLGAREERLPGVGCPKCLRAIDGTACVDPYIIIFCDLPWRVGTPVV